MTVKAIASQGSKLYYSDGGSPTSFSQVMNVTNIRGLGGGQAPINDTSNLDSTFKEKLMGLPDEGQIQADINLDPDDASHQALQTARKNRTRLEFKITLTDTTPTIYQFYGYVMALGVDIAVGQQVKAGLVIEIDGEVSRA
jgi:hypothetical protein